MNGRETYRLKLMDPRWQKLRLRTFERDEFKCTECGREDRPLHVHHKQYTAVEPWDEPMVNLATVCVDCHSQEHGISIETDHITSVIEAMPPSVRNMKEMVFEAISNIQKIYETRGAISGLETGFPSLDKMCDGMHAGEMIVIAGRPSMGKTSFATGIVEHVAINLDKPVAFFSLEMSSTQLTQRMLYSLARVNGTSIRNGFLAERDFPALTAAAARLCTAKLTIDDQGALAINELARRLRYYVKEKGVELAVIDYLQLLRSPTFRAGANRQVEIAEISGAIKALAKELCIPIIALAQLNRSVESRTGESRGRPRLADLRESGSIEQDADLVILLVREDYYAENEQHREEMRGKAVAIIAKQRNGPVGDVPLCFINEFVRFEEASIVPPPDL